MLQVNHFIKKYMFALGLICVVIVLGMYIKSYAESLELSEKKEFRFGVFGDVSTLDPYFATETTNYPIVRAMFNGLVRFRPGTMDYELIEPDLAKSWQTSKDGKVWIFNLREGVKWHKGYGEFTAEDVKFSFDRVMDPQVGSPWRQNFQNLQDVRALGKYRVQFTLKNASRFFLPSLTGDKGSQIVCKKAVNELGNNFKLKPIGTGPFQFDAFKSKEYVILKANTEYFKGKPYLDKITFRIMPDLTSRELALRNGELEGINGETEEAWVNMMKRTGFKVDVWGTPGNANAIFFNLKKQPLDKLIVRKALAYATNRDEICEVLGKSIAKPWYSPVNPAFFGYIDMPKELRYEYDVAKSRQLLKEAGLEKGFSLTVKCSGVPLYRVPTEIIQSQWKKVGVDLKIEIVDHATYHKLIRDDANPIILYSAGRENADTYLTQFYHSDSIVGKPKAITNFSHYGEVDADGDGIVDSVDNLIEKARSEMDPKQQKDLYAKIQIQLMQHLASFPTHIPGMVVVRQPYVRFEEGFIGEDGWFSGYFDGYTYNEKTRILKH